MPTGARIQRGFRRLGVVVAAPFAIGAVIFAGAYVYDAAIRPTPAVVVSVKKPPGLFDDLIPAKQPEPEARRSEVPLWAAAFAFLAIVLYGICAAAGWIFAGFARD